jgi:hypothetical protein
VALKQTGQVLLVVQWIRYLLFSTHLAPFPRFLPRSSALRVQVDELAVFRG